MKILRLLLPPCSLALLCLAAVASSRSLAADRPALLMKTYVYKQVGDVKIEADVYRPEDDAVRPVLVWIHGGALIVGNRQGVPQQLLDLCRDEGYALVSIDYRLAPETKLPAIIEDIKDAFAWIRGAGAEQAHLDPQRLVVSGGSAGGYLTMMTGFVVEPRPKALVAYWGYGNLDAAWYSEPSKFYRETVALIPKDVAYQAVGKTVLTGAGNAPEHRNRGKFYHYLRQNGLWLQEVAGMQPGSADLTPYCPVKNIDADYPPILMVHGTVDTDVPYEQSAEMAEELVRRKLPHELVTVPGAGHGLSGGDPKLVAEANERALQFIREHLK